MRHCDGRLFDGSACNNDIYDCAGCSASGCYGDGCDNQRFMSATCDCGTELTGQPRAIVAAA